MYVFFRRISIPGHKCSANCVEARTRIQNAKTKTRGQQTVSFIYVIYLRVYGISLVSGLLLPPPCSRVYSLTTRFILTREIYHNGWTITKEQTNNKTNKKKERKKETISLGVILM